MKAIDRLIEWWDKEYVPDGKVTPQLALISMARRLAAEEKSGDEGLITCPKCGDTGFVFDRLTQTGECCDCAPTPKEAPEGLVEKINYMWSKVRGGGPSGGGNPRPCYDCVKELKSLADRPAPSRTGELVKRLRALEPMYLMSPAYMGDALKKKEVDEILRDFEGAA